MEASTGRDIDDSDNDNNSGGDYLKTKKSPRNDFIEIIADRVVKAINENVDDTMIERIVHKSVPTTEEAIRTDLPFYYTIFDQIKYQRDWLLVGEKYANERPKQQLQQQRGSRRRIPTRTTSLIQSRIPRDATAYGYIELVKFGSWFVPSSTTKEMLMPIVLSMPTGTLNDSIITTVSNSIALAQPSLDLAVKDAVMDFIDDPQIRELIKSRTQKILRVNDE